MSDFDKSTFAFWTLGGSLLEFAVMTMEGILFEWSMEGFCPPESVRRRWLDNAGDTMRRWDGSGFANHFEDGYYSSNPIGTIGKGLACLATAPGGVSILGKKYWFVDTNRLCFDCNRKRYDGIRDIVTVLDRIGRMNYVETV